MSVSTKPINASSDFTPGDAATSQISLSQAILAPLDAIGKAQVHAARSFLNFVMQIGFPHLPLKDGEKSPVDSDEMYVQQFHFKQTDSNNKETITTISIPALALVPVQPIAIEKAQYDVELVISSLDYHTQIQESERRALNQESSNQPSQESNRPHAPRPWYLVSDPVSVRGTLSDPGGVGSNVQKKASIKVHVEVGRAKMPAGLDKLLSSMTQHSLRKQDD